MRGYNAPDAPVAREEPEYSGESSLPSVSLSQVGSEFIPFGPVCVLLLSLEPCGECPPAEEPWV